MTLYHVPLVFALILALLYGAVYCMRPPSALRTLIKTASIAALALWALLIGGPAALVIALGFSALGDACLAGSAARWLLPGMTAFFAAHIAYVALFLSSELVVATPFRLSLQTGLAVATLGMIIWLWPKLGAMRLPVLAYSAIILSMGVLSILLPDVLRLATWGAMAFIASDAILSAELFATPETSGPKPIAARLVWGLYFSGQALIAAAYLL